MKKIILSFLMGLMICSSFVLSGCKKDDEDETLVALSQEELEEYFGRTIKSVIDGLEDMKLAIDGVGSLSEERYVAYSDSFRAVHYINESEHCVFDQQGLVCREYDELDIENSTRTIDYVAKDVDVALNAFKTAKFARYRGRLINLETGKWTLVDEFDARPREVKVGFEDVALYDSYMDYTIGEPSVSMYAEYEKNDTLGYDISDSYLFNCRGVVAKNLHLKKYGLPEVTGSIGYEYFDIFHSIPGNFYGDLYAIKDEMVLIGTTLVHFSTDLTTLNIDSNIKDIQSATFKVYTDKLQLANIVVDGQDFYNNVLKGVTEVSKDKLQSINEVIPTIYLKDNIQIEENDYFKTLYYTVTTNKPGYVKYIKK